MPRERIRRVFAPAQTDVVIPGQVRDDTGVFLTTADLVILTIQAEFPPFFSEVINPATISWHDPALVNDPRWNPPVDGPDGFNFHFVLDALGLDLPPGMYRLDFDFRKDGSPNRHYKALFDLSLTSGAVAA